MEMHVVNPIKEIKKRFPTPTNYRLKSCSGYCVGGAATLYHFMKSGINIDRVDELHRFPLVDDLAWILMYLNKNLYHEKDMADYFADSIINANDYETIDSAWEFLELALTWKPTDKINPVDWYSRLKQL